MKLKQLMAGATIAGALGQPRWAWGPVRPAPLRGRSPVAMAHPRLATPDPLPRIRAAEAATDLAGPVAAGPVARVDRATRTRRAWRPRRTRWTRTWRTRRTW